MSLTRVKDSSSWTRKVVFLLVIAHILNAIQGHVENKDLDDARVRRGNNLGEEHGPGRDLHVMPKLEIRDEIECLRPVGRGELM